MASDPELERHIAKVSAALNAVYNGSGPDHSEADRWLQDFQRSKEAWRVADAMLRLESAELNVTFFAAQTIHAKIRSNFRELPQDSIPSLRDSLVNHLARWGGVGKSAVITRLCLALSALALQANWADVLRDLTSRLMLAGPPEQQNQAARVLLEFMKVLPEEAVNQRIVVPDATREAFLQQLCTSSSFLLSSLEQIAAGPLGAEVKVQETVFQCLQSWVKHVNVPPDDLAQNPLLPAAFDALGKPELFETAVDVIVEILRKYQTTNYAIVQLMVPKAMALEGAYEKAAVDEDEDVARGLCRLFTEMGEAYMDVIMAPEDRGQLKLVQLVLLCTTNPSREISTIPLYFWYSFSQALESLGSDGPDLRSTKCAMFGQCVIDLVGVLLMLMRYPEDIDQLSDNEVDDLKRHRYDVADVLLDICRILGGVTCLRQIVVILDRELVALASLARPNQPGCWCGVEACLFGIRAVGKMIPQDENVAVPQVVGILPRLPGNFHVRYTATLIVGKFAQWLKAHPEHLTAMFGFLMEGFASPDVMPAATTALKNLCHLCGGMMGEQGLNVLEEQLNQVKTRTENRIEIRDELELLEGLSYVISTLPPAPAAAAIKRLVEPMAAGLQRDGVAAGDAKLTQQELDRLTVVVSHANPATEAGREHPIVAVVRELWPVLGEISSRHQSSAQVFEKLCRFFKHAMRAAKEHFEPLLKPLIAFLVGTFRVVPHSSCLYCGSICVTEFGRRGPQMSAELFQMINDFSQAVFRCLETLDDFTANPDVVEEFYYLIGRFVAYCPDPLVRSPLLPSVVQCGIVGLQLHHREAQRGVLHCFEEIVGLAMPPPSSEGQTSSAAQQFMPTIEQVLRERGQELVHELVKCCVGEVPSYSIDGERGSVAGLLWKISVLCPSWLQEWLLQALGSLEKKVADDFQKQEFMERLFGLQADKGRPSFDRAVARFSSACFQNQRNWSCP